MAKNTSPQFLPDKPLTGNGAELEFGYEDIAESLYDMATKVPAPYTIGLFGKWGSGKSTILGRFDSLVEPEKVVAVYFDIWKYESDALRRSFLMDLTQQLIKKKLLRNSALENLKRKLYLRLQQKEEVIKPSWRQIIVAIATGILTFILTTILPVDLKLSTQIGSAVIIALITLFRDLLSQGALIQDISVSQERLTSPEEFNEEFEKILGHKKLKGKRLVIVIDNLDRVQKDKTIELLGTVKTYLTSDSADDDVVFIIACDDKAIKEQIERVFRDDSNAKFSADEYLRKFFNASIRIPQVLNIEVDAFTGKLLNQTNYDAFKNDNVRQIINLAFKDNPREIKQFINDMLAYCTLADRRSTGKSAVLDSGFSADNIEFITKLQAIRQKYPDCYAEIERRAVTEADTWEDITKDAVFLTAYPAAASLHKATDWVMPVTKSLFTFFTLRRSSEDRALPGWDQYLNAALNRDFDTALKAVTDFDLDIWANQLYDYSKYVQSNNARLLPFLATTFQVIKMLPGRTKDDLKRFQSFLNFVAQRMPSGSDLASIYDGASADFVFPDVYDVVAPSYQPKMITRYSSLLLESGVPEESEYQLMTVIAREPQLFNVPRVRTIVDRALRDRHLSPRFFMIFIDSGLQDDFISKPTRSDFVKSLATSGLEDNKFLDEFDLLTKMRIDDLVDEVVAKINDFVTQENATSMRSQKANLSNYVAGIFKNLGPALEGADTQMLHNITSNIAGWQQAAENEDDRFVFTKALFRAKKYHSGDMGGHIDARIGSFIQNASYDRLKTFIDEEGIDLSQYQDNFVQSVVNNQSVLPLGFTSLDVSHKHQIISLLLDRARSTAGADAQISCYREIHKLLQDSTVDTSALIEQYFTDLMSFKAAHPGRIGEILRLRGVLGKDRRAQLKEEPEEA